MASNSAQFRMQIANFVKKAKGNAHLVVYKTIVDIGTRIVERSPVGNKEFWAVNDHTALMRETLQTFREEQGKSRFTQKTVEKHFPSRGPAGYVGGRFRANWQYSEGAPAQSELYDPKDTAFPGAADVVSDIATSIGINPGGKRHYLMNNLPYAQRLENGWSQQAPSGMVAVTVTEFRNIVDAIAREVNK